MFSSTFRALAQEAVRALEEAAARFAFLGVVRPPAQATGPVLLERSFAPDLRLAHFHCKWGPVSVILEAFGRWWWTPDVPSTLVLIDDEGGGELVTSTLLVPSIIALRLAAINSLGPRSRQTQMEKQGRSVRNAA